MNDKGRFVRLFGILGQLSPYSHVTIHDLAEEYEVSERTIRRDVESLEQAKLGVFFDENKLKLSGTGYRTIRRWLYGEEDEK